MRRSPPLLERPQRDLHLGRRRVRRRERPRGRCAAAAAQRGPGGSCSAASANERARRRGVRRCSWMRPSVTSASARRSPRAPRSPSGRAAPRGAPLPAGPAPSRACARRTRLRHSPAVSPTAWNSASARAASTSARPCSPSARHRSERSSRTSARVRGSTPSAMPAWASTSAARAAGRSPSVSSSIARAPLQRVRTGAGRRPPAVAPRRGRSARPEPAGERQQRRAVRQRLARCRCASARLAGAVATAAPCVAIADARSPASRAVCARAAARRRGRDGRRRDRGRSPRPGARAPPPTAGRRTSIRARASSARARVRPQPARRSALSMWTRAEPGRSREPAGGAARDAQPRQQVGIARRTAERPHHGEQRLVGPSGADTDVAAPECRHRRAAAARPAGSGFRHRARIGQGLVSSIRWAGQESSLVVSRRRSWPVVPRRVDTVCSFGTRERVTARRRGRWPPCDTDLGVTRSAGLGLFRGASAALCCAFRGGTHEQALGRGGDARRGHGARDPAIARAQGHRSARPPPPALAIENVTVIPMDSRARAPGPHGRGRGTAHHRRRSDRVHEGRPRARRASTAAASSCCPA